MKRSHKRANITVIRLANFDGSPCRPDKLQFEPNLEEGETQKEEKTFEHQRLFLRSRQEYELLIKLTSGEIVLEALVPYFKVRHRSSIMRILRRYFVRLRKQYDLQQTG